MQPLLRWVLSGWQGRELALALEVTLHRDRVAALVSSVQCDSGGRVHPLPANTKGRWMQRLRPAVPASMHVLLRADRGLGSPRLWRCLRKLGWHPLLRGQNHMTFAPEGSQRGAVRTWVR